MLTQCKSTQEAIRIYASSYPSDRRLVRAWESRRLSVGRRTELAVACRDRAVRDFERVPAPDAARRAWVAADAAERVLLDMIAVCD